MKIKKLNLSRSVADTEYLRLDCSNDPLTAELDLPGLFNSVGDLKIMPDVQGDVVLFGDTDVGDAVDGKKLIVSRKAAEGDNTIEVFISQYASARLEASTGLTVQSNAGSVALNSATSLLLQIGGTNVIAVDSNGDTTVDGKVIIDDSDVEAFLVRKDGDTGDIFIVDTTNEECITGGTSRWEFTDSTAEIGLTANPDIIKITSSTLLDLTVATNIGDGTNETLFAADGLMTMAGTARVKKEFSLLLSDFNPGASGPTKALHDIFPTFEFTIDDDMHTSFELPTDWATGTDVTIEVYWAIDEAYATNSGEVRWSTDWRAVAVGELISGGASGTVDFGDVNIPATANTVVKTEGTISGASLDVDDLIAFNGGRVDLVAGSNPTAEPYIIAVRLEYTADKLGEAT